MKHLILTVCPLTAISAGLAVGKPAKLGDTPPDRPREPVDWVDCMIGTSSSRWMLYPGPSMPFGMVNDLGVHKLSGTWQSPNVPSPQDWVLVMGKVDE